tara:strand:+ start:2062 stop:3117 length:1056 start_codon:yes stop_codon:yes gene_type:complete
MYYLFIFIFIVILFLYLHIWYQYKTSDDLEIYSIEQPTKTKLEEICNMRQPVIFDYYDEEIINNLNMEKMVNNFGIFDVKIREKHNNENDAIHLPFSLKETKDLFSKDDNSKYYSENNSEFLNETVLIKKFKYNDSFLRPPLMFNCKYDFMFGSENSSSPLRYDLNFRNYYYVTEGSVKLKLIPPKFTRYLHMKRDYGNFEFISPINCWDVQEQYIKDFGKIKLLDVTLNKGEMIYIPAYWWYSIKFSNNSVVSSFKYKTVMNVLSIVPHLIMKVLQQQNIKIQKTHLVEDGNERKKRIVNETGFDETNVEKTCIVGVDTDDSGKNNVNKEKMENNLNGNVKNENTKNKKE